MAIGKLRMQQTKMLTFKSSVGLIAGLLIICLLSVPGLAVERSRLGVEELEVGMRGYGLTVFQGDRVETFAIEILGVLQNVMPGQDIILIRAESPTLERTNVLSGMSGSPIYVDEKLIGALAYSWAYQKEPIAGVTPAENLLSVERVSRRVTAGADLQKIAAPVVATGFDRKILPGVKELFEARGLQVELISGGQTAAAGRPGGPAGIEPGSALGVQLVRGDLNLASVGTVTEVDRSRGLVYGFGHPFMNEGEIDFPMTVASVQTLLPSLVSSFKIATTGEAVGAITEDRQGGLVGQLGREAEMLPLKLKLNSPGEDYSSEYFVEIVKNRELAPQLLNLVVANFSMAKLGQSGINLVETELKLEIENNPDLQLRRLYSSYLSYDPLALLPLDSVWNNPFEPVEVTAAEVEITLHRGQQTARLTSLWSEPAVARPGEKLTIYTRIDPYRAAPFTESFSFRLPEQLDGALLEVVALPAVHLAAEKPAPDSLGGLIENLNNRACGDQLAVVLLVPGLDLQLEGEQISGMPRSLVGPLLEPGPGGPVIKPRLIIQKREIEYLVSGRQALTLPVKK